MILALLAFSSLLVATSLVLIILTMQVLFWLFLTHEYSAACCCLAAHRVILSVLSLALMILFCLSRDEAAHLYHTFAGYLQIIATLNPSAVVTATLVILVLWRASAAQLPTARMTLPSWVRKSTKDYRRAKRHLPGVPAPVLAFHSLFLLSVHYPTLRCCIYSEITFATSSVTCVRALASLERSVVLLPDSPLSFVDA